MFWPGFPFANDSGNGQTKNMSAQLVQRLCDRQAILGNRLARALIDPALCEETPPAEPTLTFTADPSDINEGESSTLEWSTNATSCTASLGWSGAKATSGDETVSPDETTTYTLSCSGPGGSVSESVTVTVGEGPLPTPNVSLDADPTSVAPNGTSTLTWDSSNATSCTASDGWSGSKSLDGSEQVIVSATTTYTILCGNGVSTSTDSVTVDFVPAPVVTPSVDHLLISEVSYDVDTAHGTAGSPDDNEWIELYNPTGSTVDLSNWWIADASNEDKFPNGTTIAAGGFLVITSASTTSGFWGDTPMVSIERSLGNGLGNAGDALSLLDANGATTTVDALSWGSNTSVFTLPDVEDGHSLVRLNLNADTDTAADWSDDATPAPGNVN